MQECGLVSYDSCENCHEYSVLLEVFYVFDVSQVTMPCISDAVKSVSAEQFVSIFRVLRNTQCYNQEFLRQETAKSYILQ